MTGTMFPGTYATARYWTEVEQATCRVCRETMPATLFPVMESGTRRATCAACIHERRLERGRPSRSVEGAVPYRSFTIK